MRGYWLLFSLCLACSSEESSSSGEPDAGNASDASEAGVENDAGSDVTDAGPQPDDLSSMLEPIRAANGLPALAGAVWQGDTLIAIGATGSRKLGDPTPVTIEDKWHLGSDTKAMTATLIGIHVDLGFVQFDDTIGDLFAGETIDPGYVNVTILQLLQHIGGAPAAFPPDILNDMWAGGNDPLVRAQAAKDLIALPPAQAVGTYTYSNAGYVIAGAALERVMQGKPWEELMQDHVFAPLTMKSCGFGSPGTPNVVDQPWGHDVETPISPGPGSDNPPALGPAGTVHCSLTDWGKFLAIHLHGARNEPVSLISQSSLTVLQTPYPGGDYAGGWGVATNQPWAGGIALTHSGSNTLWFATTWIAPAKNTTLAVVTNRGDDVAASAVNDTFLPLIETYIP
jgi:CubicO group peptidase (beta-lactamase class C family)